MHRRSSSHAYDPYALKEALKRLLNGRVAYLADVPFYLAKKYMDLLKFSFIWLVRHPT